MIGRLHAHHHRRYCFLPIDGSSSLGSEGTHWRRRALSRLRWFCKTDVYLAASWRGLMFLYGRSSSLLIIAGSILLYCTTTNQWHPFFLGFAVCSQSVLFLLFIWCVVDCVWPKSVAGPSSSARSSATQQSQRKTQSRLSYSLHGRGAFQRKWLYGLFTHAYCSTEVWNFILVRAAKYCNVKRLELTKLTRCDIMHDWPLADAFIAVFRTAIIIVAVIIFYLQVTPNHRESSLIILLYMFYQRFQIWRRAGTVIKQVVFNK